MSWNCMLGVVKRAVLGQCWFHFSSPSICGGAESTRALASVQFFIETLNVGIQQRHEICP